MKLQQKSQGFRRARRTREKTSDVSEFLKAAKDYAGRGTFEKARMETSKARSITEPSLSGEVWTRVRSYATAAYFVLGILAWGAKFRGKKKQLIGLA
jgi:hypothetical protein